MFWTKKNKDKTAETKEVSCPNCRVSDETLRILKEKGQKTPSFAKASSFVKTSADKSTGKEKKQINNKQ